MHKRKVLLASHEMSPEKIAYQKLQALSYGHNTRAKGGIERDYFSLKKSTARCKTLCVSANVMAILQCLQLLICMFLGAHLETRQQ
jgi:hypothetical protein